MTRREKGQEKDPAAHRFSFGELTPEVEDEEFDLPVEDAPQETPARPRPGPLTLSDAYDEEYASELRKKASVCKARLLSGIKSRIFENSNEADKFYLAKSNILEKWKNKMEETNEYENLDIEVLKNYICLMADYAELQKDLKHVDVYAKKMALRRMEDERTKVNEELGELLRTIGELVQKAMERVQASKGLQAKIEDLDKELYEERNVRKSATARFMKRLVEYLIRLRPYASVQGPQRNMDDMRNALPTPPLSPGGERGSEEEGDESLRATLDE